MTNDEHYGPLFAGEALRDAGVATVTRHNESWMDKCLSYSKYFVSVQSKLNLDFTGEDIRVYCERFDAHPCSPNAWGALINALVRRKVIRATGQYRQPKDKSSHARAIQVYEAAI